MYESVVSSKGQIVLPAELREKKKLRKGTKVVIEDLPEGIFVIQIPDDPVEALRGFTKGMGVRSSDIKKMRLEDDRKRWKKLGI